MGRLVKEQFTNVLNPLWSDKFKDVTVSSPYHAKANFNENVSQRWRLLFAAILRAGIALSILLPGRRLMLWMKDAGFDLALALMPPALFGLLFVPVCAFAVYILAYVLFEAIALMRVIKRFL